MYISSMLCQAFITPSFTSHLTTKIWDIFCQVNDNINENISICAFANILP